MNGKPGQAGARSARIATLSDQEALAIVDLIAGEFATTETPAGEKEQSAALAAAFAATGTAIDLSPSATADAAVAGRAARELLGIMAEVPEMQDALAHWIALFERQKMGKLRVIRKSDGALVGRCGFGVYGPDDTPEIGYSLYPEFWGNGYVYEAASALRDWYWRETDRDHFIGLADVRNENSLKVLRKLGGIYTHTGDNDHGHHCEWYRYDRPAAA